MARTFRKDNPNNFRRDDSFDRKQRRKQERRQTIKAVRYIVQGAKDPDTILGQLDVEFDE